MNKLSTLIRKLFPEVWINGHVKKMKIDTSFIKLADKLLGRHRNKRIDFFPANHGRGFRIVIDNKICLWFFQDGDHFYYDGWEVGKYKNGEVTILDELKRKKNFVCDDCGRNFKDERALQIHKGHIRNRIN